MKVSRRTYLVALAAALVLVGILGGRFFSQIAAQNKKIPAWVAAVQGKQNAVAWQRREIPVNRVNSKFRLDLPAFSPDTDWIVGLKPIKEGEKERMFAGIVTWEDAIDKEGKSKGLGFKKISKIENYPQETTSLTYGAANFSNILNDNQTLVIYMEVEPSAEIAVDQKGQQAVLKASDGSCVLFNGEKELAQLEGPASLLTEMQMRKLKKEAMKAGHNLKTER